MNTAGKVELVIGVYSDTYVSIGGGIERGVVYPAIIQPSRIGG